MKKANFFTLAAAALLAGTSATQAASTELSLPHVQPEAVTPLDTFSFDVIAFNNTAGVAAYAVSPDDVTFGTTATTTGLGSSVVTITSSESVGVSTTTDTFTVSTPTNFAPTGYKIGTSGIKGLEFDIDQDTTYADPVNTLTPITGYTVSGTSNYSGGPFALTPTVTGTSTAYGAYEGVSVSGTSNINALAFNSFTITLTYPTLAAAPEPSTYAAVALGALALGTVLLRRHRRPSGL